MSKLTKRFFAVLLSVMLLCGNAVSALAETLSDNTAATDEGNVKTELTVQTVDQDKIHVPTLSDGFKAPQPQSNESRYSKDDIVRVSIELSKPSVIDAGYELDGIGHNRKAISYRQVVASQQKTVTRKIESALNKTLDVVWNLTLAANIISANVRYGDIMEIKKVDGVVNVFVENRYEVDKNSGADPDTAITSEYMTGAAQSWALGYTGAGSKVAIIDTGVNHNHLSFNPDALAYSLTKDGKSIEDYDLLFEGDIADLLPQLNANNAAAKHNISSAEEAYKNLKIPFAFNYIDGNYTTDHYSDTQGEHGSHVGGIAAANRYVEGENGEFVDAAEETGAVGMAPDAQILVMKVFGKGGGAYDSDYFAAIEDAVILGADAINLSLGSANGFTFAEGYQSIMDKLVDCGATVSISAGNNYAFTDFMEYHNYLYNTDVNMNTAGSPGTYINSLSVAAAENIGSVGRPIVFNGSLKSFYTETESKAVKLWTISGSYDYVYIDAIGDPAEYQAVNEVESLAGKVVLVNRGSLSFVEKGNNLIDYNPAALIIVNNQPGTINMALDDYTGSFPMVSILQSDGAVLKQSEKKTAGGYDYYTGTVVIYEKAEATVHDELEDAVITDFSSWGVPSSLVMKPEITAPGGNIWSVNGMTDNDFETMGGTSMSAPAVGGLAAVVGQYIEETGLDERLGLNKRTVTQSLLMSTASPMINDGAYVPILRQGSGLADVYVAVTAKSFLTMNEDATNSYADGKIKVELGQDAKRNGVYEYSFNITNMADETNTYLLFTELFTQDLGADSQGQLYMLKTTRLLEADDVYDWQKNTPDTYDVDKDGDTDKNDVQAILDYLTGILKAEDINTDKADFDGNGKITSLDAYKLLKWLNTEVEEETEVTILPGQTKTIKVKLTLSDEEKEILNEYYPNGAYIEGFTFAVPTGVTTDDAYIDASVYSIPILGFFGSWTDPTMFENTNAIKNLYGNNNYPYFGDYFTSMLSFKNPGDAKSTYFSGNPYLVEDEWPEDRLAINGNAVITDINYILTRNAGTFQGIAFDEDNNILYKSNAKTLQGAWYYVNGAVWYNNKVSTQKFNAKVADLGLNEGDKFTFGLFAVPEYYALMLDKNAKDNRISAEDIVDLYAKGEIGKGAMEGYTFMIDSVAPQLLEDPVWSEDKTKVTVKFQDNQYVAAVMITDISGNNLAYLELPEQTEPGQVIEMTFDTTEIEFPETATLTIGDYASNQNSYLLADIEGTVTVEEKVTIYKLTANLAASGEYIILNTNQAGAGVALKTSGPADVTNEFATSGNVTVKTDDQFGTYIEEAGVEDEILWTVNNGVFTNKADGSYLGYYQTNYPYVTWSSADDADTFNYSRYTLSVKGTRNGMYYDKNYYPTYPFFYGKPGAIYLYEKTVETIEVEIDPNEVSDVIVNPDNATLIMGVNESVQLTTTIKPMVIPDKSVTWSSEDESVATVDAEGYVTAVAPGRVLIRATSNKTPSVYGTCEVTVLEATPVDAVINGQVQIGEDVKFVSIDLNDMSMKDLGGSPFSAFYGGGRGGNWIYGNDADNDFHRYDATNGFAYDGEFSFALNPTYAIIDGAAAPKWTSNITGEETVNEFILCGFSEVGHWEFLREDKSLTYFALGEGGYFYGVALDYIGADANDGNTRLYYMILDSDGDLCLMYVQDTEDGKECEWTWLGTLSTLRIGEDLTAYSMAYQIEEDGDGYKESLFIADNTTQAVYMIDLATIEAREGAPINDVYVGQLNGTENISTLWGSYDADTDALNSSIIARAQQWFKNSDGKLQSAEVKDASEIQDEQRTKNPYGTLDVIKSAAPAAERIRGIEAVNMKTVLETETADETTTVTVTDTENLNNALYTITYDPEELTFVSAKASDELEFNSLNVDEEKGEIIFTFVSLEGVEAGSVLATIKFEPGCLDSDVTVVQNEANENTELDEETAATIKGLGHLWGEPTWDWNDDNTAATATFICQRDPEHEEEVNAEITEEIVKEPTGTEDGEKKITATVTGPDGKTYTDTKTVVIPANPDTPDTGDHSHLGAYIAMMTISGLGLAILLFKRRKGLN